MARPTKALTEEVFALSYDKLHGVLIGIFRERWHAAMDYEITAEGETVHILNKDELTLGTISYSQLSDLWDIAEARLSSEANAK